METTPESESKKPGPGDLRVCTLCRSHELRRLNRTIAERLFFQQPYHCARCKNRHNVFRLSWLPFVTVALIIVTVVVWAAPRLPIFNEPTTAATPDEVARAARVVAGAPGFPSDAQPPKKPKATLDNSEILRLWKANVGKQVILQMIRTSNGDYDVDPTAVIVLREAQVDESIILAMIEQNNRRH